MHVRFPAEVTIKGDTISCGNGAINVTDGKDPAQLWLAAAFWSKGGQKIHHRSNPRRPDEVAVHHNP